MAAQRQINEALTLLLADHVSDGRQTRQSTIAGSGVAFRRQPRCDRSLVQGISTADVLKKVEEEYYTHWR